MTAQVLLVVTLQEYVAVVFLALAPMVRVGQGGVSRVLQLLLVFVSDPSRHRIFQAMVVSRYFLLFSVLRGRDQVPDEAADLLVAAVKTQAVKKLQIQSLVISQLKLI